MNVLKPLVFVDLDDTLFQTRRKCAGFSDDDLDLGAISSNAQHSYLTPKQSAFIAWLLATTDVIPVTARGGDSFKNVKIPFNGYAILANGATILTPDGSPDDIWRHRMSKDLKDSRQDLERLLDVGRGVAVDAGISVRSWIVEEDGLAVYLVFKENEGDGSGLQSLRTWFSGEHASSGWTVHHNGNNLAVIPGAVSKKRAVTYLMDDVLGHKQRPVIGFGDSISDLPFLGLCDWWGAPRVSQISGRIEADKPE